MNSWCFWTGSWRHSKEQSLTCSQAQNVGGIIIWNMIMHVQYINSGTVSRLLYKTRTNNLCALRNITVQTVVWTQGPTPKETSPQAPTIWLQHHITWPTDAPGPATTFSLLMCLSPPARFIADLLTGDEHGRRVHRLWLCGCVKVLI